MNRLTRRTHTILAFVEGRLLLILLVLEANQVAKVYVTV